MTCWRCGRTIETGHLNGRGRRECWNRRDCTKYMADALAKVRRATESEIAITKHKPDKGQGSLL
jgi:hypothetical protein